MTEAIRDATLVFVPAAPASSISTLVKETIEFAREARKPYAVIVNAAPPKAPGRACRA